MALARWDPFREMLSLERTLNRFLSEFDALFGRPLAVAERATLTLTPQVDLYETDDAIVVKAVMPGVKPEDVEITIAGDVLTLRGEIREEAEEEGATYYLKERVFGTFQRSIRLPAPVIADQAEAIFENGVLTLILPKVEEARPKQIAIKVKKGDEKETEGKAKA
ncbi:MAG: Hsp20/alpha crystallin family protein [Chloroflexi bacterium]|nr:Hsp20/alpha crystallin family protein [Chloroflexota bacterium]